VLDRRIPQGSVEGFTFASTSGWGWIRKEVQMFRLRSFHEIGAPIIFCCGRIVAEINRTAR
jgi:hypothetical protein